jgi:serine protease Do
MKKIKLIALIILAFTTISYSATYTVASASYPINVNGQRIAVTPLNNNGTTYLPLRSVSEAVGAQISWTGKSVEINTMDVEAMKEACVMIQAYGDGMTSHGSGVYVDYDKILTAYHVVDEGRNMIWDSSDTTYSAINFDQTIDIVTVKASKEVKPVKIGDSDEVKVGDKVIVIGAPDEKEDTVTYTTVKALTSDIVISGTTNEGSSGGGLFNTHGELVGIVVAGSKSNNETYVVPINTIRKSL